MVAILQFIDFIVSNLLELIMWIVVAYVVLTWLVSFQIVNLRNRIVYSISRFLEAVANPLLRPIRRVIPALGGLDFSPIVLFLLIQGTLMYLLPALFGWLEGLASGGVAA
jgi:YggT family protein